MRILAHDEIKSLIDIGEAIPIVEDAFLRRSRWEIEEPVAPPFRLGMEPGGANPRGAGAAKTAYLHGSDYYVTKLLTESIQSGSAERPTVTSRIVLVDIKTGEIAALLNGKWITLVRTGAISGLAARELANGPITLAVIGAGQQAKAHTRAIAAVSEVTDIRVFSPSDSKQRLADELIELGLPGGAVETPGEAVAGASVVLTATTSATPVFPPYALEDNALVIAVGSYSPDRQEIHPEVFERADTVFADVLDEVAKTGDCLQAGIDEADLTPFARIFDADRNGKANGILIVETVGTASLDAAVSEHVYERANDSSVGRTVNF